MIPGVAFAECCGLFSYPYCRVWSAAYEHANLGLSPLMWSTDCREMFHHIGQLRHCCCLFQILKPLAGVVIAQPGSLKQPVTSRRADVRVCNLFYIITIFTLFHLPPACILNVARSLFLAGVSLPVTHLSRHITPQGCKDNCFHLSHFP